MTIKTCCTLFLFTVAPVLAADGTMSTVERTYLVEQLENSKKQVLASIKGLDQTQWTFKPAPAVWSVQEVAEHIILSEAFIFAGAEGLLQTPAVPRPANSTGAYDRGFVAGVQDRSHKLTAPEPIVPSGKKYTTPEDAAREFTLARDKTIAYAKTTNDDLRVHVGPGPAGPIDSYQFLLLLSSHSIRHTKQILEVEANSAYPKSE